MKIRASLAVKLALVFSVGIATVVLFFSAFTMALMRYEAMQQQNEELLFYAQKIITYWDQTEKDMIRFEAELQIPYYISY
ncbi:MAG TPA: hypothetical protein VFC68_03650, partial [Treponemataceae bacterium]|nr:hypothetical protein [Treponemataceae bacterium]